MVDRFTSAPLELPDPGQPFNRADLVFYGVESSAGSYEGRVFLNAPRVARTAQIDHPACVGSFFVFGHRGCAGDVGHCDLPDERDPFDFRLPHHLEPGLQILTVTENVRSLLESGGPEGAGDRRRPHLRRRASRRSPIHDGSSGHLRMSVTMTAAIASGLRWSYLIAFAIFVVILIAVHVVAKLAGGSHGVFGLVLGTDGRTSTSKLSAALWTLTLLYAFAVLIVANRASSIDPLQQEYLLLLGGPFAAAIGAKASTSSKVADGRSSKTPTTKTGVNTRLAEIVANDEGDVDLGDFQYFAFSLLTIVYFFVGFIQNPVDLPDLPNTLVGLSTVSATAYLTKKVAISEPGEAFRITSVRPSRIVLDETSQIHISGSGFIAGDSATEDNGVLLDGVELEAHDWNAGSVKADLVDWAGGGLVENLQADLVVHNSAGTPTEPFKVRVQDAP